jgi:hypothetical protein
MPAQSSWSTSTSVSRSLKEVRFRNFEYYSIQPDFCATLWFKPIQERPYSNSSSTYPETYTLFAGLRRKIPSHEWHKIRVSTLACESESTLMTVVFYFVELTSRTPTIHEFVRHCIWILTQRNEICSSKRNLQESGFGFESWCSRSFRSNQHYLQTHFKRARQNAPYHMMNVYPCD